MVPRIYWQSPPFSSLASEELECGLLKITPKRLVEIIRIGIRRVIVLKYVFLKIFEPGIRHNEL